MAEALARQLFERRGIPVEVSSAGTLGIEGHPAATHAVEAVAELGCDLSRHRSRGISPEVVRGMDTVVIMAPEHEGEVAAFVRGRSRIGRLWEFATPPRVLLEIRDPVGGSLEEFLSARDDILECLENWIAVMHPDRG